EAVCTSRWKPISSAVRCASSIPRRMPRARAESGDPTIAMDTASDACRSTVRVRARDRVASAAPAAQPTSTTAIQPRSRKAASPVLSTAACRADRIGRTDAQKALVGQTQWSFPGSDQSEGWIGNCGTESADVGTADLEAARVRRRQLVRGNLPSPSLGSHATRRLVGEVLAGQLRPVFTVDRNAVFALVGREVEHDARAVLLAAQQHDSKLGEIVAGLDDQLGN